MVPNEAFQKLLYDLFCLWHGVQRHYDPPITDSEEQRMDKVKNAICKLLTEIDGRVNRIKQNTSLELKTQDFYEEWTMLTWNVLCITSRMQNSLSQVVVSNEDKMIYSRLNQALVELVNYSREFLPFPESSLDQEYGFLKEKMSETMMNLHNLYRQMNSEFIQTPDDVEQFRLMLQQFGEQVLIPCIELFKGYCNKRCQELWTTVRGAQIQRMRDQGPLPDDPVTNLVSFYSQMMYVLAVLGARLQGFRYDLTMNKKMFGTFDPVLPLSEAVFSALELLMSNCVLATEPSTCAILVTNNLFSMNCGALARGVVFKDFEIQIVSEETAEHIQSDLTRQRLLQHPGPIQLAPSAALLAMKPTSGTKRSNASSQADTANNTAHKKSDVNSKESVIIYPIYNSKNRYWAATYPHLLCTTRQKGRHSTHSSFQDLSPSGAMDKSNGKRPIFYFHIKATMFSPSGRFATAHTLSLPFTIATRRNQDCQVQRMMSSYTATIFWLYGCNSQDGLLLNWIESGQMRMSNVTLIDGRFPDLLKATSSVVQIVVPDAMLQSMAFNVRFLEFEEVDNLLAKHKSALIMRLSFRYWRFINGTICFTVKSTAHTIDANATKPLHLEPLDLKRLQQKCLKDYLRDIADAEKVKYIVNANLEVVRISEVLAQLGESQASNGTAESRDISSNITHVGDIDTMQHIRFTAMRIAVVTCKVKPPSADFDQLDDDRDRGLSGRIFTSQEDDFLRELVQLANYHGKTKQDVLDALDYVHDTRFTATRKTSSLYDGSAGGATSCLVTPVISPRPPKFQPPSQLPSPNSATPPLSYSNLYDHPNTFEY
ncbi:unnamed protein product [Caenorhabditis auriculariae]|uniref:Uncharacterized protein n=1 Tax=Caenorhabditis auriculariae TaxID=2777116 RepID=A0A8S1I0G1_9PELO|nr:unnamed protein product [Caenorhabditis auriculariae]